MFKMHYHIETVSNLPVDRIIDQFTTEMEKLDYQVITSIKPSGVTFKGYKRNERYAPNSISKIDKGELLVKSSEKTIVSLTGSIGYSHFILIALVIIGFAIITKLYLLIGLLVLLAIGLVFKITAFRSTSRELLRASTNRIELSLTEDNGVLDNKMFF